ncbi:MAG: hypothetical protein SV186_00730 [Candidatus Nanohaloarchaea archaeon]|nr:hypothetical protein [Candidatus Nanohaloarchaea archaeon]
MTGGDLAYRSSVLADGVDDIGQLTALLYEGGITDPLERAKEEAGDVAYETFEGYETENVEEYRADPETGIMSVRTDDGEVKEYWVMGATESDMLVATEEGCQWAYCDSEKDSFGVRQAIDPDTGGYMSEEDVESIYPTLLGDMYSAVLEWDAPEGGDASGIDVSGGWETKAEVFSDVIDLLEEEGELEIDRRFKQQHIGQVRGDHIAVEVKKTLERLDKPYETGLDSTGQNARLYIEE